MAPLSHGLDTMISPTSPSSSDSTPSQLCHKVGRRIAALDEAARTGLPRVRTALHAEAPFVVRAAAAAHELRTVVDRLDELNEAADACLSAIESLGASASTIPSRARQTSP